MPSESSVSGKLISHLGQFRSGALAPEIRRRSELCLLDSLSCFSAGRSLKHYAPIVTVAGRLFGLGSDGAPTQGRPSPFTTAYLYGEAANLLDYDDTLFFGHPGAAIVGSVLAVAADRRLSTDRLLRGIAAGYEAQWLLSAAAAPTPERGALVRSVGVWDAMAATVGIIIALGLDDALVERAMGLAVAHSLLPYTAKWYERPVPSLKNNLGWAGAGAVLAADLAIAGKTGVTNPLEGDTAMWRMAGSDRWNLDPSLFDKVAVLRVGFKTYPVCWHLQEYLKTLSELLASMEPEDDVVELVLTGPKDVERFCQREIISPTDTAFSLPAAFSLLISGIEPGPQWAAFGEGDEPLRYRSVFRFELSQERAISLGTRRGFKLKSAVVASNMNDLALGGLDDAGVVAKHERLADPELRAGAAIALATENPNKGGDPRQLYDALHQIIVRQLNERARS